MQNLPQSNSQKAAQALVESSPNKKSGGAHELYSRSRDRRRKVERLESLGSGSSFGSQSSISDPKDCKDGRWNQDQHHLFEEGLDQFGKNWKKIAFLVKSRNSSQVRSHAQKYFYRLEKEQSKIVPESFLKSGRSLRDRTQTKKFGDNDMEIVKAAKFKAQNSKGKNINQFREYSPDASENMSKFADKKVIEAQSEKKIKRGSSVRKEIKTSNPNAGNEQTVKLENDDSEHFLRRNSFRQAQVAPGPNLNLYGSYSQQMMAAAQDRHALQMLSRLPGQIVLPISYFMQQIFPRLGTCQSNLFNLIDRRSQMQDPNSQLGQPLPPYPSTQRQSMQDFEYLHQLNYFQPEQSQNHPSMPVPLRPVERTLLSQNQNKEVSANSRAKNSMRSTSRRKKDQNKRSMDGKNRQELCQESKLEVKLDGKQKVGFAFGRKNSAFEPCSKDKQSN